MTADSDTNGPGTPIKKGLQNQPDVHNYYAGSIFIMKFHFLGLCVPHICLVGLAAMWQQVEDELNWLVMEHWN